MKKGTRRLRRILIFLAVLFLILFTGWLLRWPLLSGTIRRALAEALDDEGIRITAGEFSGSLLSGVTITQVRAVPTTENHLLREASVRRVHLSYSLAGLVAGDEDWLGDVEIEGLRALVDLEGEFPPPDPDRDPAEVDLLPDSVLVTDAAITVLSKENVLTVKGGFGDVVQVTDGGWKGTAGAASIVATVEGRSHAMQAAEVEVTAGRGFVALRAAPTAANPAGQRLEIAFGDDGVTGDVDLRIFGGRISGDVGSDGETVTATLDLEAVEPAPLLAFVPGIEVRCERVSGHVAATWRAGDELPAGTYDLTLVSPRVEGNGADRVEVKGSLTDGVIEASGKTFGPAVEFGGTVRIIGPATMIVDVKFESLDLAALRLRAADRIPSGRATGTASIRGSLASPIVTADLSIEEPSLGEHRADRLEIEASATLEDVDVRRLLIRHGPNEIDARGVVVLDEPPVFSGSAVVSLQAIEEVTPLIPAELPEDLAGSLVIGLTALGTPDHPHAEVTLSGEGITVEGILVHSLEATFDVPGFETVATRHIYARSDWIEVEGTDIDVGLPRAGQDAEETTIHGMVQIRRLPYDELAEFAEIPDVSDCEFSGRLSAAGPVRDLKGDLYLSADAVVCRVPGREDIVSERMEILARYRDRRAILDRVTVAGEGWALTAEGRVESDPLRDTAEHYESAALTGRVVLGNVPLELTGPIPGLVTAEGGATAILAVSGNLSRPIVNGPMTITAAKLVPENSEVPPLTDVAIRADLTDFGLTGGDLGIRSLIATAAGSEIRVDGLSARLHAEPFGLRDLRLDATIDEVDVVRWAERFGLPQFTDGSLFVTLSVVDGPEVRIGVEGEGIVVRTPGVVLEQTVFDRFTLDAAWKKGLLTVRRAEFRSEDRVLRGDAKIPILFGLDPFMVEVDRDRPLSATVTGEGLQLAPLLERRGGLRLDGNASIELTANGLPGAIDLGGTVAWSDGHFRYPGAPPLDGIDARFRLVENRIVIEKFAAQAGRGTLGLTGRIGLERDGDDNVTLESVDLALKANRALVLREDDVMIRADLDTTIRGGGAEPFELAGDIGIVSLRYTEDVEYLTSRPSLAQLPLTDDPVLGPTRLDLRVTAPPGTIKARNNVVNADFEGELTIGGTVAMPRPAGRVVANRGSVKLPVLTMKIASAVFEFRPRQPFRPQVDAVLTARAGRVTANAHIRGTPDELDITASSIPPLPSEDVITLLATGEVPANVGAASAATVATTILYRQLVSEFTDEDDEESTFADLASRVEEVSVDAGASTSNGYPAWRATIRIADEFLYLRADQADAFDYGLDLLIRLSFR